MQKTYKQSDETTASRKFIVIYQAKTGNFSKKA